MRHRLETSGEPQMRPATEADLDAAARELLHELQDDERVRSVNVFVIQVAQGHDAIARARATLADGQVCEALMFSPSDALWVLALDHRLREPFKALRPRRFRSVGP